MTPAEFAKITADHLKALSDSDVIDMYRKVRIEVMASVFKREKADSAKRATMVAIGDALETRIGEKAFEFLMVDCDKAARITHG